MPPPANVIEVPVPACTINALPDAVVVIVPPLVKVPPFSLIVIVLFEETVTPDWMEVAPVVVVVTGPPFKNSVKVLEPVVVLKAMDCPLPALKEMVPLGEPVVVVMLPVEPA